MQDTKSDRFRDGICSECQTSSGSNCLLFEHSNFEKEALFNMDDKKKQVNTEEDEDSDNSRRASRRKKAKVI